MRSAAAALPLDAASRLFKALGDPMRLRIVSLLSHGELCVCHLEAALELRQTAASRHLAVLKAAGVVESRKQGSWVHYRLAPQADAICKRQLQALSGSFAKERQLTDDVARLVRSRGPGMCQ